MRFYKKISLCLSMGIMGIGLASFSFTSSNTTASNFSEPQILTASFLGGDRQNLQDNLGRSIESLPTPSPSPTLTPTPTPEPTNDLLKNEYTEINELINSYFEAKLECTEESFDGLVNDVNSLKLEKLQKETEYIKEYKNINCYTKKGNGEIDFIVYITFDIAVTTIDELAPSIDQLLIKNTASGEPQIFFGEISAETENYIAELDAKKDVQKLVQKVDRAVKKAIKADADLAGFWAKLQSPDTEKNETKTPDKSDKNETNSEAESPIDPNNTHQE